MLKILRIKEAVGLESMSVRQKLKHGGMAGELDKNKLKKKKAMCIALTMCQAWF